jgi:hypothetical protein
VHLQLFSGGQTLDSTGEEISFLAFDLQFRCLPTRLNLRAIDRGAFLVREAAGLGCVRRLRCYRANSGKERLAINFRLADDPSRTRPTLDAATGTDSGRPLMRVNLFLRVIAAEFGAWARAVIYFRDAHDLL